MGDIHNTTSTALFEENGIARAFTELRVDLLGFVFQLSWMYLLFYAGDIMGSQGILATHSSDAAYLWSAVPLAIVMLVGALWTKRFMSVAERRPWTLAAPLITALGTLLYVIHLVEGVPSATFADQALVAAAGILTGVGSAALSARWASVFGSASSDEILCSFPALFALICAICLSVVYLPYAVYLCLLVALPLASGACLHASRSYIRSRRPPEQHAMGAEGEHVRDAEADRRGEKRFAGLGILVALAGFSTGFLSGLPNGGYDLVFYIATLVVGLCFFGYSIHRLGRAPFAVLFAAPVVVAAFVLLPYLNAYGYDISALVPVGGILFELLLLYGTVIFALRFGYSSARSYLTGRISLVVSDVLGAAAAGAFAISGSALVAQTMSVILLIATELLLVFVVFAYLSTKDRTVGDGLAGRNPQKDGTVADAAPANAIAALADDEHGQDDGGQGARLNDTEGPQSGAAIASVDSESTEEVDPTDAACASIAQRYGLSPREGDVLRLLARGWTSARIQDELCISKGTANYHTRNIYAKLNVHSRQNVIDMVREERLNDRPDPS